MCPPNTTKCGHLAEALQLAERHRLSPGRSLHAMPPFQFSRGKLQPGLHLPQYAGARIQGGVYLEIIMGSFKIALGICFKELE